MDVTSKLAQMQCLNEPNPVHMRPYKKEVDVFITSNFFCLFKRGSKAGKDKKLQNSKIEIYLFICMCMLRNGCGLYEAPACDCHSYSSWLMWSESLHTAVELKSPSWRKIERPLATQVADGAGGT